MGIGHFYNIALVLMSAAKEKIEMATCYSELILPRFQIENILVKDVNTFSGWRKDYATAIIQYVMEALRATEDYVSAEWDRVEAVDIEEE